ncbi:MAG: LCP family protein [Candidatus Yanofskybacteria bacterium]|nr:LCP family protein [Candidatus Yanofskybacteria bacterium]
MDQLDFNNYPTEKKRHHKRRFFLILGIVVLGYIFFNTGLLTKEFEIKNKTVEDAKDFDAAWFKRFASLLFFNQNQAEEIDTDYIMPEKEPERLDILILGIRGEYDDEDEEAGSLLTDTIMVFSHDQLTKRSSLVSIPRDLYVKTGSAKNKLNAAYEYGLYRKEGTDYVKKLVSQITGIYIDNVIVADFSSFEKLIDQLGGIEITLVKPFTEEGQWGYVFKLPAGENHLNGQDALYYVRSRYSTSDFDRAFRQQQVLFAIKNKLTELNALSDPIKTLSVINTLNQNIKTDINIWDVKEIIDLGKEVNTSPSMFKKQVLSTDNLLYQTTGPNNAYILLPTGDNFDQIKQLFQEILI